MRSNGWRKRIAVMNHRTDMKWTGRLSSRDSWVNRTPRPIEVVVGLAVALLVVAAWTTRSRAQPPAPPVEQPAVAVDDARIAVLIRRLGDPSYEVRTRATRELCKIGHRAGAALKKAAAGDEFEIALRAASLLEVIDSVYFGGCRVELSAEPRRIAWDQTLEVVVTIRNESDYPAQIPLELSELRRRLVSADAQQVGDMVDLADYLRVVSPDGRQVDLKVDDILTDLQVADAIEWRAESGPVGELPPGRTLEFSLGEFNRGWARYPLLARGMYKIVFEYDPQWDDEEFRRAGVGRVRSKPLEIEVTEASPPMVRPRAPAALVAVERNGEALVARLTNCDDLPVWVNLNWGSVEPPFSQLVWRVATEASPEGVRVGQAAAPPPLKAFDRERLTNLPPGATAELGAVSIASLLKVPLVQGLPAGQSFRVRVELVNQCDLVWQRQQEPSMLDNPRVPAALQSPLPRRMLTGRFDSQPLELTKSGAGAGSQPGR
jgi:hypothetical protein